MNRLRSRITALLLAISITGCAIVPSGTQPVETTVSVPVQAVPAEHSATEAPPDRADDSAATRRKVAAIAALVLLLGVLAYTASRLSAHTCCYR